MSASPAPAPASAPTSAPAPAPAPPRKRWVAALLSLVIPGLGQIYLGRIGRGLAWALAPLGVALVVAGVSAEIGALSLGAVFGAVAVCWIGSVADAGLAPRRERGGAPTSTLVVVALGVALFVANRAFSFAVRAYFVEAFKVPSGAMIPTVRVGDHLFTDKLVYRKRAPERGELMAFYYPEHPDEAFLKRVVGVGGDTIEVKDQRLFVNGWAVPRCDAGPWSFLDPADIGGSAKHDGELYVEFLGRSAYLVFLDRDAFSGDVQGPYDVAPGTYFVMGDNRNDSHDSRMWFGGRGGTVPADEIIGRARMIWLSSPRAGASRFGVDVSGDPAPPLEAKPAVDRCLASRPPLEETQPPSGTPAPAISPGSPGR
jgi:signal peptidase I